MDATSEATKDFFSADQFEHYMQEWSKQNEDREAVFCVRDTAGFVTLEFLANTEQCTEITSKLEECD